VAFNALLDASVLVPAALRDTLLRAAGSYLYRLLWSSEILAEVERALLEGIGLRPEQVAHLLGEMRGAFPEAEVDGYHDLIEVMTVDPGDRHVAAAAVRGSAQVIVTLNLSDFPQAALDPYNIEVQSPDEFLEHLFDLDPDRMVKIVMEQAAELRNPPQTPRDVCASLRLFVPRFVASIEAHIPPGTPQVDPCPSY
jgi:predicted nucleic acid-binding protein